MYLRQDRLIPFFLLLSVLLHTLLFVSWPVRRVLQEKKEIPIVVLPTPEAPPASKEDKAEPPAPSRQAKIRTRPSKGPAVVAKRTTPVLRDAARHSAQTPSETKRKERREQEPPPEKPVIQEDDIIVRRPLPTLKDLLPPVALAPLDHAQQTEGSVRLDTREPQFIEYFSSIKRDIELVWKYPESALRSGLEGRLILEFTVLSNGELEGTHLIRSSGFPILDEEALRAVKAAAPFHPIPPWIGRRRLPIIASFEYHDDRLRSRLTP